MNRLIQDLIAARDLPSALRTLSEAKEGALTCQSLRDWGRKHLSLAPDIETDWLRRAWWGLMAGELVRAYLYDPELRAQVLALVKEPDWTALERARARYGGVILVAAHIGPPRVAMNYLMDSKLPMLIWARTADMPDWMRERFRNVILDPALNPSSLAHTAMHLKNGGMLYGAPDVVRGKRRLTLRTFNLNWEFSLGIPALARTLNFPVFRFLALWNDHQVQIEYQPVTAPDDNLAAESWDRQWIEAYWRRVVELVQQAPENLRFLLFVPNGRIRKELDI